MKKIIAMLMVFAAVFALVSCTPAENDVTGENETDVVTDNVENTDEPADTEETAVMTYEQFASAELETPVTVETYIQAKQGWREKDGVGVATFYTQNEEGAYFIYEMPCSKEDYDEKLVTGAKIRVSGFKSAWAGEVEIIDATYEVLEGEYVAEPVDITDKLGTEELINYQNMLASFKGMTVEKIEYKNGEPGDDIYVTLGYNGESYNFCVEVYLTGTDSEVYQAVGALTEGDVVNVDGFVYWYEGINTHITSVELA